MLINIKCIKKKLTIIKIIIHLVRNTMSRTTHIASFFLVQKKVQDE